MYHFLFAFGASFIYGDPTSKMIVIGVTGTKGKSTTVRLLGEILETAGYQVGSASTIEFVVPGKRILNNTKMTMVGRFHLQKLLRQMLQAGCTHVVVETTSQGIEQYRHLGIHYDVVAYTNLTPEHIEAHGGFENYKRAKGKLFTHLAKEKKKFFADFSFLSKQQQIALSGASALKKRAVVNLDDPHALYFLSLGQYEKWGYTLQRQSREIASDVLIAAEYHPLNNGGMLKLDGNSVHLRLLGRYNAYNALCAAALARTQGVSWDIIQRALENVRYIPGRLEFVENNRHITIIVDYAHEPESLRKLYEIVKTLPHQRIIHILGSCGGGRDAARRPVLGGIAGKKADIVIVTNEDPYDDDPQEIIAQVAKGAQAEGKSPAMDLFLILDRREAIAKALTLAKQGDLLLVTGKGSEQAIVIEKRKKIPWDDRQVIQDELARL